MANLPDGTNELLEKPVAELEAELRRLVSNSRMPPSAGRQLLESFALQSELPDASQRERAQRTFLIHAITAYRQPAMRQQAGEKSGQPDFGGKHDVIRW